MKLKTRNLTFIDLSWVSINNVPVLGPFLLTPLLPASTVVVLQGLTLQAAGLRLHCQLLPGRPGQWEGSPGIQLLTSDTSCLREHASLSSPLLSLQRSGVQQFPAAVHLSMSSLSLNWLLSLSITYLADFWYSVLKNL